MHYLPSLRLPGAPLPEVLALVRQHANSFPCVELKYADQVGSCRRMGSGRVVDQVAAKRMPTVPAALKPYYSHLRVLLQGSAAAGSSPPDIGLSFPEQGFHLLFDGRQQRLRLIDVHDTTRLQVAAGGMPCHVLFCLPAACDTLACSSTDAGPCGIGGHNERTSGLLLLMPQT